MHSTPTRTKLCFSISGIITASVKSWFKANDCKKWQRSSCQKASLVRLCQVVVHSFLTPVSQTAAALNILLVPSKHPSTVTENFSISRMLSSTASLDCDDFWVNSCENHQKCSRVSCRFDSTKSARAARCVRKCEDENLETRPGVTFCRRVPPQRAAAAAAADSWRTSDVSLQVSSFPALSRREGFFWGGGILRPCVFLCACRRPCGNAWGCLLQAFTGVHLTHPSSFFFFWCQIKHRLRDQWHAHSRIRTYTLFCRRENSFFITSDKLIDRYFVGVSLNFKRSYSKVMTFFL